MAEFAEPVPLQREANTLRDLLDRFRDDSKFLLAGPDTRIVYFIDAHDLDSYIAPDKPEALTGFLFEAENAAADPHVIADCAFKSEQILQRLLFDGNDPVGLLPSHGEEIQDHVAYHAAHYQRETLELIVAAQKEFRRLNQNPIARQVLSQLDRGQEATAESREQASKLLEQFAPALMTYLSKRPKNPRGRINALVSDSRLVGLEEFAWERLALSPAEADSMRSALPTEEHIYRWRRFLDASDARRERSNNANRIDAEALACMEVLSGKLRHLGKGNIRIVLVTRVMSLIRATRKPFELAAAGLSQESFLRHPRMIFLPGADAKLSTEVIEVLGVALNTFENQLIAQGEQTSKNVEGARQIFVKALHDFEKAQFALELRTDVESRKEADEAGAPGRHVRKLLEWFADDSQFDAVIREEAAKSVRLFGYETFTLGTRDGREPIEAVLRQLKSPRRVSVRPIVAGVPGPVEFRTRELHKEARDCEDLEKLIGNLQGDHAERYLAWALLHACRNRWELAKIYARSALRVARFTHSQATAAGVQEAQLLLAQVQRLSGPDAGSEWADEAVKRLSEANRLLEAGKATADVRVLQEQAAQILECCLTVGSGRGTLVAPIQGLNAALRARELSLAQGDELAMARSLGQLLLFVLASQRRDLEWPLNNDAIPTAREWHLELRTFMQTVRKTRSTEEIPGRVLAMELIGYRLAREDEAEFYQPPHALFRVRRTEDLSYVPEHLRHGARELHLQLSGARDQIGRLIASELEEFVGPQDLHRRWELIYAPVWPPRHAETIVRSLQGFDAAQERARVGYGLLSSVIGPTERGVDPAHRRVFARSATWLSTAIEILRADIGLPPTDPRVLQLRMDQCYARILVALVTTDPAQRHRLLLEIADDYERLASDSFESSMVHFRLHVIYSELEEGDARQRAHMELERARTLLDSDPFMASMRHHWVRSTIQRRLAMPFFAAARAIRRRLRKGEVAGEIVAEYKDLLQKSFQILYEGFPYEGIASETDDKFTRLEMERRVNNLVYAASLFLEVQGELSTLHANFTRGHLERLTARLNPQGIELVDSDNIAHTVGFAHHVLGNFSAASSAGERLMQLIYDRGLALSAHPDIVDVIEDALEWRRGADRVAKSETIS